ncbi:unnamed protein product [Polarella glacialis]|uniref:CRAL-TRIO domain-containing protein n=1 Tax=Polarella glacialis TaxID=89957 RepID=A0A813LEE9_POLGL|nr:unnamed protein product [Polarella glacialis]
MAPRGRRSLLSVVLLVDALLIGSWCISAAFVSAPAASAEPTVRFLVPAAAAAAAMLPAGAQAVERWTYQEPNADGLTVEQIQVFLWFVLFHLIGLADFYAKKIGAGPAIPVNPFRSSGNDQGQLFKSSSFYKRADNRSGVDESAASFDAKTFQRISYLHLYHRVLNLWGWAVVYLYFSGSLLGVRKDTATKLRAAILSELGLADTPDAAIDGNFRLDLPCFARCLHARLVPDHFETIAREASSGKSFVLPFKDAEGRPIMIMRPRNENSKGDHDANIMSTSSEVYQLERAVSAASAAGHEKWVVTRQCPTHAHHAGDDKHPPGQETSPRPCVFAISSVLPYTFLNLQFLSPCDHYPERLHRAYLVDAPWLFQGVFKAISPFIDSVTRAKEYLAEDRARCSVSKEEAQEEIKLFNETKCAANNIFERRYVFCAAHNIFEAARGELPPGLAMKFMTAAFVCKEARDDRLHLFVILNGSTALTPVLLLYMDFHYEVAVDAIQADTGHESAASGGRSKSGQLRAQDPASRLMHCISRIVEEKRAQFMHFRLQWLVFEFSSKKQQRFELPEALATPRSVHQLAAREAWWFSVRNNLEVQRRIGVGPNCVSPKHLPSGSGENERRQKKDLPMKHKFANTSKWSASEADSGGTAQFTRTLTKLEIDAAVSLRGASRHALMRDGRPVTAESAAGVLAPSASLPSLLRKSSTGSFSGGVVQEEHPSSPESPTLSRSQSRQERRPSSSGSPTFSKKLSIRKTTLDLERTTIVLKRSGSDDDEFPDEFPESQHMSLRTPLRHHASMRSVPSIDSLMSPTRPHGRTRSLTQVLAEALSPGTPPLSGGRFISEAPSFALDRSLELRTRLVAPVPLAPWMPRYTSTMPGNTQSRGFSKSSGSSTPASHPMHTPTSFSSGLPEHRILLRDMTQTAVEKIGVQRRQSRIDKKIDSMCSGEQVEGMRRFIRQCHDGDAALNSCLKPFHPSGPLAAPRRVAAIRRQHQPVGANDSADVARVYAVEAFKRNRLPNVPKCLQPMVLRPQGADASDPPPVRLDIRNLNLVDDEAVPLVAGLREESCHFEALLLGGNPRLSDVFHEPLLRLASEHPKCMKEIDLSGARGMGDRSLSLLAEALPRAFRDLRVLRFEGIVCLESSFLLLAESMKGLIRLEELGLANMQIGRISQRTACAVAELVLGLPGLSILDLSSNFFAMEGCKMLARSLGEHAHLSKLDLSHNAGGFVLYDTPGGSAPFEYGGGVSVFNPLSLICEGVAFAQNLKVLSLSQCQLNFDEDFILEDALQSKRGVPMEELDLSGNPFQGAMGTRCLLRIAVRQLHLWRLDLFEIREAPQSCAALPYEQSDPTAHYNLRLDHPQHRALLRTLLRRADSLNQNPEDLFKFDDAKTGEEVLRLWQSSKQVQTQGDIEFNFRLPIDLDGDSDIHRIIRNSAHTRKIKVGLTTFTKIAKMYRAVSDSEGKRLFLQSMGSDLMLKLSHVRYLSSVDPLMRVEIVDRLMPAVQNLDRMGGFDLVMNTKGFGNSALSVGRKSILDLLLFNPACPDGAYRIDVTVPADRKLMEQIIVINQWAQARAIANGRTDMSKHGGHECIRNCLVNGSTRVWSNSDFSMPQRGEVALEYCSPFHPPTTAVTAQDSTIEQIAFAVENTECNPMAKVGVLRSTIDKICLTGMHCSMLIEALPSSFLTPQQLADNPQAEPTMRDTARVEAFVILYSRCVDIHGLLESVLYGIKVLTRAEVLTVCRRLGRTRTWDMPRLHLDCLIPDPRPATMTKADKLQLAAVDGDKQQPIMQDFGMLADPTSIGNANFLFFDLSLFEDWHCARLLLLVSQAESGEHFDEPSWSEKAHLAERGSNWIIPGEWMSEVPTVGIFGVRYIQGTGDVDMENRLKLAALHLGW